jgi:uncharacterized repeat protein (TIGR03803 family)
MAALVTALPLSWLVTNAPAAAQTETVLHNMKTSEGVNPVQGLIFDSAGALYGVAADGGSSNNGSVFKLTKSGSSWTEKTLHSFAGGTGGSNPLGSVVMDSSGNLYGTAKTGGSHAVGVAYKLAKSGTSYTYSVIHNFGGTNDGQYPVGALIIDSSGNLYGTTEGGGSHGNGTESVGGTAFKLAKSGTTWTETVLHNFGSGTDGKSPRASLVMDSSGILYGTTFLGGTSSLGTAFKLAKSGSTWTETVLHNFTGPDGAQPAAGMIFDSSGNLYGTTTGSGIGAGGNIFELSPSGSSWTETNLFTFIHTFYQPSFPYSNLVFDSAGNLYGTTLQGFNIGSNSFAGTVFELSLSGGSWNINYLYSFDSTHGAEPGGGALVLDSSGNLYGATQAGGTNKNGVVFEVTP